MYAGIPVRHAISALVLVSACGGDAATPSDAIPDVSSTDGPENTDRMALRVAQMNVAYGCTTHTSPPRDAVGCIPTAQVAFVAAQAPLPDVVSMNEAFDNARSDGASGMKALLEAATGVPWHRYADPSGRGNALFSRHAPGRTAEYTMVTNGQYVRSIVAITIEVGGKTVTVFSTHLDHTASGSTSSIRVAQVRELKTWIAGRAFEGPHVVLGDFNALATNQEIAEMRDSTAEAPGAFVDAWLEGHARNVASSYPDNPVSPTTRTRRTRLDYVWFSAADTRISLDAIRNPDTRDFSTNATQVGSHLDPAGCPDYAAGTYAFPEDCFVRPSDHQFLVADLALH